MPETITIPRELLESLLDEEGCMYDHHGGCQTHGYLDLEKGQRCPQEEARELLKLSKPSATHPMEGEKETIHECCGQQPGVFEMRPGDWVVHCQNCWDGVGPCQTRQAAVAAWNAI